MNTVRKTLTYCTLLLSASMISPKAEALPRGQKETSAFARVAKPSPEAHTFRGVKKISDGEGTYFLKKKTLEVTAKGKFKSIDLSILFTKAGIDPDKADMKMDRFPPKMKSDKNLIYVYSSGAKGIIVVNPRTNEKTWIDLSAFTGLEKLRNAAFELKNNIIAITGSGLTKVLIAGIINLSIKDGVRPVEMDLRNILNGSVLKDPKIEIRSNRVYISDEAFGKGKRYFYEVFKGTPMPITVEAED